jgi:hypothetical protein
MVIINLKNPDITSSITICQKFMLNVVAVYNFFACGSIIAQMVAGVLKIEIFIVNNSDNLERDINMTVLRSS